MNSIMRHCTIIVVAIQSFISASVASATPAPIIGGAPTDADPAVVGLTYDDTGTILCTATLIAPSVLLTAAHCVAPVPGPMLKPRTAVFRAPADDLDRVVAVDWVELHPHFNRPELTADIALVGLTEAVDVRPVLLNTKPMDQAWEGRVARWVGFGFQQPGPAGQHGDKHAVEGPIGQIDTGKFSYGPYTCLGDSGGAAIATIDGVDYLIGVISSGSAGCHLYGRSTRVDAYADWITTRMDVTDVSCDADDRCSVTCQYLDPDCTCLADGECAECGTGVTDADCAAHGDTCATSQQCMDGLCLSGTCHATCELDATGDADANGAMCPLGSVCAPADESLALCVAETAGGCHVGHPPNDAGFAVLLIVTIFALRRRSYRQAR